MKEFEVRRIFLPEDTVQIQKMQANAREFVKHYPKHEQWLNMAIDEVLKGERIAFGIHKFGADTRRRHLSVEIVGSIILKKKLYTGIIEIKNLFIREKDRGRGFGRVLLEKVEDYCAKSGYSLIETEVPCKEINTIGFLHKMGFRVCEMEASPYKEGEYIYRMHKTLYPLYGGDSFDFRAISIWVLKNYYGFSNIKDEETGNKIELLIDTKGPKIRVNRPDALPVRGVALLFDQSNAKRRDIEDAMEDRNDNFSLVFAANLESDAVQYCNDKNIKWFDEHSLIETFKDSFAYKPPNFLRNNITGLIVVINPSLYSRIDVDTKTSFTYFKDAPVGKYLKKGDKILVASQPTPTQPFGGVKGLGEIDEFKIGTPAEIWEYFKDKEPLFAKGEYDLYTGNKQQVIGFHISNYKSIKTIEYFVLLNDVIQDDVDLSVLGHYYINNSMYSRLKSLIELEKTMTGDKYKVALSFAGEDRQYAEELADILKENNIPVFYDSYEQADLWGKDLYQHLQKIYRDSAKYCVVFLSKDYASKLWTKHELKQAQARAFREHKEYILPVKIDDTEIPGINETICYLDLRKLSVRKVADILLDKIRKS